MTFRRDGAQALAQHQVAAWSLHCIGADAEGFERVAYTLRATNFLHRDRDWRGASRCCRGRRSVCAQAVLLTAIPTISEHVPASAAHQLAGAVGALHLLRAWSRGLGHLVARTVEGGSRVGPQE